MACALPGPCRMSPTSRPVYTPSSSSATVPSAPESPSRDAITRASMTGVAVTSHTCWPASRCICTSERVPGQTRSSIEVSTTSSLNAVSSATVWPLTKLSALSRPAATSSAFSLPETRNLTCDHAIDATSCAVKNLCLASPRASRMIEAPWIRVLSTSKNAAACGSGTNRVSAWSSWSSVVVASASGGPGSAPGSSLTAFLAEASPATRWSRALRRRQTSRPIALVTSARPGSRRPLPPVSESDSSVASVWSFTGWTS